MNPWLKRYNYYLIIMLKRYMSFLLLIIIILIIRLMNLYGSGVCDIISFLHNVLPR